MSYIVKKLKADREREEEGKKKEELLGEMLSKKFNEDSFDEKVAEDISYIRSKVKYVKKNRIYKRWCSYNIEDLRNMYELSELKCGFNEFCSLIFLDKI